MRIIQTDDLHYRLGSSDKVYCLALGQENGSYSVLFAYGRRGNSLKRGVKASAVSERTAQDIYRKFMDEKVGKGYRPSPGIVGTVFVSDSSAQRSAQAFKQEIATALSCNDVGFLPDIREFLLS